MSPLFDNDDLVPLHLWWRKIVLKLKKVFKYLKILCLVNKIHQQKMKDTLVNDQRIDISTETFAMTLEQIWALNLESFENLIRNINLLLYGQYSSGLYFLHNNDFVRYYVTQVRVATIDLFKLVSLLPFTG